MNLKDKTFLITGILTDKSIAFSAAKIALEKGATIIATGFGDGLRITQRAVTVSYTHLTLPTTPYV